jgi:hypothetical protein
MQSLQISPSGYLSFFNDFVHIEGCQACEVSPKAGFADLMKGQGSCSKCGDELIVTSSNRVMSTDVVANIRLQREYWPLSTLTQIIDGETKTIAIKGE